MSLGLLYTLRFGGLNFKSAGQRSSSRQVCRYFKSNLIFTVFHPTFSKFRSVRKVMALLVLIRYYNFGKEVNFSIQVAIIATNNTPLNIIKHIFREFKSFRR